MDCMDGIKEFPDNFFDLAVVDPPYGDAAQNEGGYWNRFGQRFDRYKKALPTQQRQEGGRVVGCRELAEDGRGGSIRQKNHIVGRGAGTGIFRGAVPRLTESDYMGR